MHLSPERETTDVQRKRSKATDSMSSTGGFQSRASPTSHVSQGSKSRRIDDSDSDLGGRGEIRYIRIQKTIGHKGVAYTANYAHITHFCSHHLNGKQMEDYKRNAVEFAMNLKDACPTNIDRAIVCDLYEKLPNSTDEYNRIMNSIKRDEKFNEKDVQFNKEYIMPYYESDLKWRQQVEHVTKRTLGEYVEPMVREFWAPGTRFAPSERMPKDTSVKPPWIPKQTYMSNADIKHELQVIDVSHWGTTRPDVNVLFVGDQLTQGMARYVQSWMKAAKNEAGALEFGKPMLWTKPGWSLYQIMTCKYQDISACNVAILRFQSDFNYIWRVVPRMYAGKRDTGVIQDFIESFFKTLENLIRTLQVTRPGMAIIVVGPHPIKVDRNHRDITAYHLDDMHGEILITREFEPRFNQLVETYCDVTYISAMNVFRAYRPVITHNDFNAGGCSNMAQFWIAKVVRRAIYMMLAARIKTGCFMVPTWNARDFKREDLTRDQLTYFEKVLIPIVYQSGIQGNVKRGGTNEFSPRLSR